MRDENRSRKKAIDTLTTKINRLKDRLQEKEIKFLNYIGSFIRKSTVHITFQGSYRGNGVITRWSITFAWRHSDFALQALLPSSCLDWMTSLRYDALPMSCRSFIQQQYGGRAISQRKSFIFSVVVGLIFLISNAYVIKSAWIRDIVVKRFYGMIRFSSQSRFRESSQSSSEAGK